MEKDIQRGMNIIRALQPDLDMGLILFKGNYTPASKKHKGTNFKDVTEVLRHLTGDLEGLAKLEENIFTHIGLVMVHNTKQYSI